MDFNGLNTALQTLLIIPTGDPSWANIREALINDAEGRIYKDMNFLGIRQENTATTFTLGVRSLALPATMILCEQVSWNDGNGSINPLLFTSLDFINNTWPNQASIGSMQYWSFQDDRTIVVAGTPGGNYPAVLTGKFRPPAMAAGQLTSYIGDNHPELLVAACMVFATGYQKDFGSQVSNPQMAVSWEGVYQSRLKSAREEEMRKTSAGQSSPPVGAPAPPPQG